MKIGASEVGTDCKRRSSKQMFTGGRFWPLWKAFHNGHYEKVAVMKSARSTAVFSPVKAGLSGLICYS
jgi:hypothetical protein